MGEDTIRFCLQFQQLDFWHDSMDMHIIVVAKLDKKIMRLTGEYRPTTFTQT